MKKLGAIVGLFSAILGLAGCGTHTPPATSPPSAVPGASPSGQVLPPPVPQAAPRTGVVYTVDQTHGTDADNYLVAHPITFSDSQSPARDAIAALISAAHTPIPSGTKLNSVKIEDGLATLDFTRSPVDETHGEEKQSQALESIQRTLGQFPTISRIQINVNGRPASLGESGGGPMDVLRPGEKPQDMGGA